MPANYSINPEKLYKFKEPFGTLIKGTPTQTMKQLTNIIKTQKPTDIITIGDTVSRNMCESGIKSKLAVTDDKSMRKKLPPKVFADKVLVHVKNPEGTITEEAITAIQDALQSSAPTQILVEGEEDMLTLIAVAYAPENSIVIYGQPNEGIVVVKVTAEKRAEAIQIWESMKKNQTK
jgi:GTP-dependent dephospho-CoA kinase